MDSSGMIRTFLGTVAVLAAAALASPPQAPAGDWTWPVQGPVLTPYANDNARPYAGGMHRGIDIGAASGAPVVAAHTGDDPFVFSLATQKQIAFNEHFMAEISTKFGYELSCWKNHPAYEGLRTYGALAP